MRIASLAVTLAAFALASCAGLPGAEKAPPALSPMSATGSITLFEGGCFYGASCKTFEINVRPDGAYTLKRINPPTASGPSTTMETQGKLDPQAFADAEKVLAEAGFETLPERMNGSDRAVWSPDVYPCMPHGPGFRVTRRTSAEGPAREVYWDTGCRSAAMSAFSTKLRGALKAETWLQ